MRKHTIFLIALLVSLFAFLPGVFAEGESVSYRAHVADIGWQNPVKDGQTAGTTGQAKQAEAIEISLVGAPEGSHIIYQTHVADIGWQNEVADGATAGTTGQAKQLEAIRIRLDGPISTTHDVYYRTHIADYGWLGWTSNGSDSGSTGMAKRVEAIEILLSPKGSPAPGTTERPYVVPTGIAYQAHVSNIGWQGAAKNGATAGTTGRNLGVEAIKITLLNIPGSIQYNTASEKLGGWQTPTADGAISGSTGRNIQLEAFNAVLAGQAAQLYDLYYRAHVQDVGWLGWAKNGDPAGSYNGQKQLEALEMVLVNKGGAAPGSTEGSYRDLSSYRKALQPTPGLRTVKNFLVTALQPVGTTNYIWGGGWNEADNAAGTPAVTIGVSPRWKQFFDSQDANYDYNTTRYQIYNGLDCSGYVGWAVYNLMNNTNGGSGEVYWADEQAQWLAGKGYGSYTPYGQVRQFFPGDVVSLNEDGHVYICIGQCPDGSVVLAHASPPGVMISGTLGPNGQQTQATQLSHQYMAKYYPEYYRRYAGKMDRSHIYTTRCSTMIWGGPVTDPDAIRAHDAATVLKILFNEI